MAEKCPGAETLLRAIIDCDDGALGGLKRQLWLDRQDPAYLQELASSAWVLMKMCEKALDSQRVTHA